MKAKTRPSAAAASRTLSDFISQILKTFVSRLDPTLVGKPLQKYTVDAIEGHPVKMSSYGLRIAGQK